jgi:hypothetical protein
MPAPAPAAEADNNDAAAAAAAAPTNNEPLALKASYRPLAKLEQFYTGGAARVTRDGQHAVCACSDEVKVVHLATGAAVRTLAGVSFWFAGSESARCRGVSVCDFLESS